MPQSHQRVCARGAPRGKQARTAAHGAEIVLYDRAREDREAIAEALAVKREAVLVPPYDDPEVIAGQGTIGREIVEELSASGLIPDIIVVTASGGGLTAGIALAMPTAQKQQWWAPSRSAHTTAG